MKRRRRPKISGAAASAADDPSPQAAALTDADLSPPAGAFTEPHEEPSDWGMDSEGMGAPEGELSIWNAVPEPLSDAPLWI